MQSQNRPDSRKQPADAAVERVLAEVLRAADVGDEAGSTRVGSEDSEEGCLDADTLAAWHERSLQPSEVRRVEAHLSTCVRCQDMLAVFARTLPAVDPGAARSPLIPGTRAFWQRWQLPWLVPLATAAGLALWVARPDPTVTAPASVQARLEEAAPAPGAERPVSATRQAAEAADTADTADAANTAGTADPRAAKEEKALTTTLATRSRPAGAQREAFRTDEAGAAPESRLARVAETERTESPAPAQSPPLPAAPAASAPGATPPSAATPPSPAARDNTETAARQDALSARGAMRAVGVGAVQDAAQTVVEIRSTAHPGRWRIRGGQQVDYADGADVPWTPATIPPGGGLMAGASPAPGVCWIVGRDGVVLRTTSGLRFTRVSSPGAMPLTAVRAVDARIATVITGGGLAFHTDDGGLTWTRVAPVRP